MAPIARRLVVVLAVFGLNIVPASAQAPAAPLRVALVIGNGEYPTEPLATPGNDAGLIAEALSNTGWSVVGGRELGSEALSSALEGFLSAARAAGPKGAAFLYLSGHVVQRDGENYLRAVDGRADIRLSDYTRRLEALPMRARFVVLDGAHASNGSGGPSGMAEVRPARGTLVAYNVPPGTIAPAEPGPSGIYASALSEAIGTGGLESGDLFARVRARVAQAWGGSLTSWDRSAIQGRFVFLQPGASPQPLESEDPPPQALSPSAGFGADLGVYPSPPATYVTEIYRPYFSAYGSSGYGGSAADYGQTSPYHGQVPAYGGQDAYPDDRRPHHGRHRPGVRPNSPVVVGGSGNPMGQTPQPPAPTAYRPPVVGGANLPPALPRRDYVNEQAIQERARLTAEIQERRRQVQAYQAQQLQIQQDQQQQAAQQAQPYQQHYQQPVNPGHSVGYASPPQQYRYAAPVPQPMTQNPVTMAPPQAVQPYQPPAPVRPSQPPSLPASVPSTPPPAAVTRAGPVAQPAIQPGGSDQPCGRPGSPPCRAR